MAYLILAFALVFLLGFLTGFFVGKRGRAVQSDAESPAPALLEHDGHGPIAPGISLVVNGRTVDVAAEAMEEIRDFLRAGKKIEAIKVLREATGMGLKEAKAVLQSLEKVIR